MFDFFSLAVNYYRNKTFLTMKLFTSIVSTSELPTTMPILQEFLPSILRSACFNEAKLPFRQEVKKTEIGHLFEHILLEYLCKIKTTKGYKNVEFSGVTNWNWIKHPRGTFHIQINAASEIKTILPQALLESSNLIRLIMETSQAHKHFNYQLLQQHAFLPESNILSLPSFDINQF